MIRRVVGFAGILLAAWIMSLQEAPIWTLAALAMMAVGTWGIFAIGSMLRRPHLILLNRSTGRVYCRDCGENCTARIPQVMS